MAIVSEWKDLEALGWVVTAAGIQHPQHVARKGEKLSEPPSAAQVAFCREWIRTHTAPRETINEKAFSYRLKHRIEDTYEAERYIANGALIQAAFDEGYTRFQHDRLNAYFPMRLVHRRNKQFAEVPLPISEWPERYRKNLD